MIYIPFIGIFDYSIGCIYFNSLLKNTFDYAKIKLLSCNLTIYIVNYISSL